MLKNDQLTMEHEHLHLLVERLEEKYRLTESEEQRLKVLKKKKLHIKDLLSL